jgi:chromosome partitioning protein
VLKPAIRRNIKLAECPSFGQTIFQYAPACPGAADYKALAEKVVGEWDAHLARLRASAGEPQAGGIAGESPVAPTMSVGVEVKPHRVGKGVGA